MKNTRILLSRLMVFVILFTSCKEINNKKEETNKQKITEASINTHPTPMSDQWRFIGEAINEPGYDIWGSSPIRDEKGNFK